jgi:uncharacterized protein YukJ
MPLRGYGVLKGSALAARIEPGEDSPHYQIHLRAGPIDYRLAVNVQSTDRSSLLYVADEHFEHPITASLWQLQRAFTRLDSAPGGMALDFIRGNLFDPRAMRVVPPNVEGPDNDLNDRLDHFVQRAIRDSSVEVYAFGERWGPETGTPDKVFKFKPGNGVHDIHMNQGNDPQHTGEDGVFQDGALLLHFPSPSQWVAIFLAFQSQAWHTDDRTGHALGNGGGGGPQTPPHGADVAVQIIAAMVNPVGPAPENESVLLLNASPATVDLTGWSIADRMKNKFALQGQIAAGAMLKVTVAPSVALGNNGGTITLLDNRGLKVHGVAYTAAQAQKEGWTIVF